MTNGAAPFMYTGSASSNSSSSSPMAATPDNSHLHPPLPHSQFYGAQFSSQEAYFHPPLYVSYFNPGDYESQEQHTPNDECSSTVSTPHSDISERSSNRSPANVPAHPQFVMVNNKVEPTGPKMLTNNDGQNSQAPTVQSQSSVDSQVPVVSWLNHAEERELYIRDGRRAFHPMIPPPPPLPPQAVVYPQPPFPNGYPAPNMGYQQTKQSQVAENPRIQRPQNFRVRTRPSDTPNSMPYIPKFPATFNNNNPLMMNKNFYDKKPGDYSNRRPQRFMNNRGRGGNRGVHHVSPTPPSTPIPTHSYVSSPSPQMMQYAAVDRPTMVNNSSIAPRWSTNPPVNNNQIKRMACNNKRQNGSVPNSGVTSNLGSSRQTRKRQVSPDIVESDVGGGGDAQSLMPLSLTPPSSPSTTGNNPEVTAKMQTLSLGTSS